MINALRMEEGRWYMVDSEGNEHEVAPMTADAYIKLTEPTAYEPYEPIGKNLYDELKIDDRGITITCEGLRSCGKSFMESCMNTINSDGINLIEATPNTPQPIKFPTLGEWDLYKHHEGCDFGCDSIDAMCYCVEDIEKTKCYEKYILGKKEGENMKILNMYVEKSQENIRKYFDNLIEMEEKNDIVKQDYDYIVEKYKKDMEKLAERYNEVNSPTGSFIIIEPAFGIESRFKVVHKTTEKEEMYYKLRDEELKQLHEKIEEVQAQLEIITNDENSSYHDVNYVLHNYGIIDDNGRLTPYTPTFVDEEAPVKEAPKKAGRPKKVSE